MLKDDLLRAIRNFWSSGSRRRELENATASTKLRRAQLLDLWLRPDRVKSFLLPHPTEHVCVFCAHIKTSPVLKSALGTVFFDSNYHRWMHESHPDFSFRNPDSLKYYDMMDIIVKHLRHTSGSQGQSSPQNPASPQELSHVSSQLSCINPFLNTDIEESIRDMTLQTSTFDILDTGTAIDVEGELLEVISPAEWQASDIARTRTLTHVLKEKFPGDTIIERREQALLTAKNEYTVLDLTNKLVFWTDGSVSRRYGDHVEKIGAAVVWRVSHWREKWEHRMYRLNVPELQGGNAAAPEFYAISQAFKIAAVMCREAFRKTTAARKKGTTDSYDINEVVIYTDSQECINMIEHARGRQQHELAKLLFRAHVLEKMGVKIVIRWVPGHAGVPGNELADKYCKSAAKFGGRDFEKAADVTYNWQPSLKDKIRKLRNLSASTKRLMKSTVKRPSRPARRIADGEAQMYDRALKSMSAFLQAQSYKTRTVQSYDKSQISPLAETNMVKAAGAAEWARDLNALRYGQASSSRTKPVQSFKAPPQPYRVVSHPARKSASKARKEARPRPLFSRLLGGILDKFRGTAANPIEL